MNYLFIDTCNALVVAALDDSGLRASHYSDQARRQVEDLAPTCRTVLDEAGWERPEAIIVSRGPATFTGLRIGLVSARTLAGAWQVPLWGVGELALLAATVQVSPAPGQWLLAAADARRKEVFWQVFSPLCPPNGAGSSAGRWQALCAEQVGAPADIEGRAAELIDNWPGLGGGQVQVVGSGVQLYPQQLGGALAGARDPILPGVDQPRSSRASLGPVALPVAARDLVLAALSQGGYAPGPARALSDAQLHDLGLGTEPLYLRRPDIHPGPAR